MDTKIFIQPELLEILAKFPADPSIWDSPWFTTVLAVFLGALFSFLTAHFTNRQNQNHSIALKDKEAEIKKQEVLHSQQLTALQALSKIYHTILPIEWTRPDYASEDAHADIASIMPSLIAILGEFLGGHSYLLPKNVEEKLMGAIYLCNENKWGAISESGPEYEPTSTERKAAEQVIAMLKSSIVSLKLALGVEK